MVVPLLTTISAARTLTDRFSSALCSHSAVIVAKTRLTLCSKSLAATMTSV